MTGPRSPVILAMVMLAVVLPCSSCGSSPDASGFRDATRRTTSAAVSEARTVGAVLGAAEDGSTLPTYAGVVVGDSVEALTSARDDYESLLPPRAEASLAGRATRLLEQAAADVHAADRALRRSDKAAYGQLRGRLDRSAARLEELGRSLR